MKVKKIRTKLLLGTIPFVFVSMVILTLISAASSRQIITEQITNRIETELSSRINDMNADLDGIRTTAMNLSRTIGATYKTTQMEDSEAAFERIEGYMAEVNEAMMSSSAATAEVTASVEEVNSTMVVFSSETIENSEIALEIKERAQKTVNSMEKMP